MTNNKSDNGWQIADSILHRFVDGDLQDRERTAVSALLANDADAFDRASSYQRQTVLLQALHPQRVEDTMLPPAGLNLAAALRRGRLVRRLVAACIGGVALVGAGTMGWQAQSLVRSATPTAPVVAVFPSAALTNQSSTVASVAPNALSATPLPLQATVGAVGRDMHPPAPALRTSDDSRVPVHPPDLMTIGYQLVDGRADFTTYGPVIRFAYEPIDGAEGRRLALTVAAFGADRQSLATTINPQHTSLFWQSGPLLYALSGNVEARHLLPVVDTVAGGVDAVPMASPTTTVAPMPVPPTVDAPAEVPTVEVTDQPKDT